MTPDQLRELAAKKAVDSSDPAWNWGFQEGASLFMEPLAVAMDCLESFGSMPDGNYYGPDDLYSDIGNAAREARAKIAAMLEGK